MARLAASLGLVSLVILGATPASAQPPFVFKLKPEQKLRYQTQHVTQITIQGDEGKNEATSQVRQLKEWKVIDVDSLGVATMEMSVLRLDIEQKSPDGKSVRYDSKDPQNSHPELVKQLAELTTKPILRVQLAANGQVKESQNLTGQKNLLRELPFFVTMTDELPRVGLQWQRDYPIPLDPPLGSGQAYKAVQLCELTGLEGDQMTVQVRTRIDEEPKSIEDKISLAQHMVTGQVRLDWRRGLMLSAQMKIDRKVEGIAGAGSYYWFKSDYAEDLVEGDSPQASRKR